MLSYLKNIEKFIEEQHYGHKIWDISISAPRSEDEEGIIEISYTDNVSGLQRYMFIYEQPKAINNNFYNILYKKDGLVIFNKK